jgi:hypothetical protein
MKTLQDFLNDLGARESGGNYKAFNKFGYAGKYQMGEMALIDCGYYKKPSYYVLQNICLIFCLKMLTLAIICIILNTVNKSCIAGFERSRQFGMK